MAPKKGKQVTFIRNDDPPEHTLPDTFIHRYAAWAQTLTDAPGQFHRVLGATVLSTIICPHVSMETSYGIIRPNLWCMILAGSTLTRKSTSMGIATKLLTDVDDDFLLATDGSPEGLFSELANRNGQVSLFHRDEITGFMAAISSRDYLSGLLESFTHLYDGVEQKRVLRAATITVTNPYFVFLCGGIKSKMEELISMDHIRSGFLPRFLIVSGTTTVDQIKPIGPPSSAEKKKDGTSPRDEILDELWRIHRYYTSPPQGADDNDIKVRVGGLVVKNPTPAGPVHHLIEATDEAWERIRTLQYDAMQLADTSSAPDLYGPLYARLSDSIVKVAILLAAAELTTTMELRHVLSAIYLSQEWIEGVSNFAIAIEERPDSNPWEKKLDAILVWLRSSYPEPLSRTDIMQKKRIRSKDIDDIQRTLEDRLQIRIIKEKITGNVRNSGGYKIYWELRDPPHEEKPKNKIEKEGQFKRAERQTTSS